ncbi:hypothetical protein DPX16_19907 [Anabarilius grahami]|uniref:Uncharacterized protein n=1 Tax=Anabarilius grahami TaxID=495550 RepID=A0A3N0YFN7_ANAGA|nr:hypothetical protein DPX16_19907 [Anabarilius grahami]
MGEPYRLMDEGQRDSNMADREGPCSFRREQLTGGQWTLPADVGDQYLRHRTGKSHHMEKERHRCPIGRAVTASTGRSILAGQKRRKHKCSTGRALAASNGRLILTASDGYASPDGERENRCSNQEGSRSIRSEINPQGIGREKRDKYEEEKQREDEKCGLVLQAEAPSRLFEQMELPATESGRG